MTKSSPYLYQGILPSWGRVAKLLKRRSGIDGLPLAYLEERMRIFLEVWNLEDFINTLGLSIYDLILLPHLDEYVDLAAIDIFLANQEQGRNPMTTVLANTYYTIQRCHERKGDDIEQKHEELKEEVISMKAQIGKMMQLIQNMEARMHQDNVDPKPTRNTTIYPYGMPLDFREEPQY
ncbi:hypothetical protein CR513_23264, partial [Mucuna pruriens]